MNKEAAWLTKISLSQYFQVTHNTFSTLSNFLASLMALTDYSLTLMSRRSVIFAKFMSKKSFVY